MKKILFIMACMTGVFMASCEKDPDMGELDADLVVYTDHDSNTDFSSFQTYFLLDRIRGIDEHFSFALHKCEIR